ncbi:MAG: DNA primase [Candidatus Diapherotrites archaeon]|nr:DNA primase [Candidatus Diapherotrites archaeon]
MAKTYVNNVKYMVKISFEVQGVVDKPDIVGAVFGQSEGLLGDEMDLKELQKNGKIGRIEITHSNVLGKTRGEIFVPSSMDMVQTSLLAATVESVDKVGPYDASFKIVSVDDVRSEKRQEIKTRAQQILEQFRSKIPDATELTESLREESRSAELEAFGAEKLPAGPDIATNNEIIVVEGRADVINLLRNNIKNVIGMNGSQIPKAIIDLSREKEVTVFVDGDRGGTLIARNFAQIARASFIAKAPDGKEVEELARKEIIQSLHKRLPIGEFLRYSSHGPPMMAETGFRGARKSFPRRPGMRRGFPPRGPRRDMEMPMERREHREFQPRGPRSLESFSFGQPQQEAFSAPEVDATPTSDESQKFAPAMTELKNSLKARLYDKDLKVIKEVETKKLVDEISKTTGVSTVVFDGIITKRLIDAADKAAVGTVVGSKKGKISEGKARAIVVKP